MPNPVFEGMAGVIFSSLKETAPAILSTIPVGGGTSTKNQTLDVIFTAQHTETDKGGIPVGEPGPVAWIKDAQVPDTKPKYLDEMCINSVTYIITEIHFDGFETYKLTLGEK